MLMNNEHVRELAAAFAARVAEIVGGQGSNDRGWCVDTGLSALP